MQRLIPGRREGIGVFGLVLLIIGNTALAQDGSLMATAKPNWRTLLTDLVRADTPTQVEAGLERILAGRPSCRDLAAALQEMTFPYLAKGQWQAFSLAGRDEKVRPWLLFIPKGYHPRRPTPLLVVLHGGVSHEDVTPATLQKWAEADPFFRLAQSQNWLMLYPFAQDGATWWDEVGTDNVRRQIRQVKTMANVDDDRVWLSGFSDGAGGALTEAMLIPDDFAAVIAANGHPALGNIEGDLPLRLPALANLPCYVLHADADEFYPVEKMRPLVEMAQRAGGDVLWRESRGRHRFPEPVAEELARMAAFLKRHPRDPLPSRIVFETEQPTWGRCRWLAIDQVTSEPAAAWHEDYNPIIRHEEVNFHFVADETWRGEGVRARRVFPMSLCSALGMRTGDVLTELAGRSIKTVEDLTAAKKSLVAGSQVELSVGRGGRTIRLKGKLPDPTLNYVFNRSAPAAMVRARAVGNRIFLETSRVGKMRLFIHPDLFNLEEPIEVTVNGRGVFRGVVEPDPAYLLRGFLAHRDRQALFVNEIRLDEVW